MEYRVIAVILFLVVGLVYAPTIAQNIENYFSYSEAKQLFESKSYELQELIQENNLVETDSLINYCFTTNQEFKKIAKNKDIMGIQRFILDMDYDEKRDKNNITHCQKATKTLGKGKGVCADKAILACSIYSEKDIPCFVVDGYIGSTYHSISIIKYDSNWNPILTTGYIDKDNIDEFMRNVEYIRSKNRGYAKP